MSSPASVPAPDTASATLDEMVSLPKRNWRSFGLVLVVQSLNAFNDNFVKMLLISLAITVAKDTKLGGNIELYLGAIFSVPYILFAPMAGWFSDRLSKKSVVVWMQVAQLVCFAVIAWALMLKQVPLSLQLSLFGFFLLATQAAFLSPAKMGIMKELMGSRRLGLASGWLQMTMMAGILAGMWAGGTWYSAHLESSNDSWGAAIWPLLIVGGLAVGELVLSLFVQPTRDNPQNTFRPALFWEHFTHLGLVYKPRSIRLASLGINYFWLISNALGFILVTLSKELHPDSDQGSGPAELARAAAILGVGVIFGSMVASSVCKRRIELGLVPIGGFGLMAGMLWAGLAPLGSGWMYAGLVFTGAAGGCFMVPLYAYVQDRSPPEHRASILSGINLIDCVATFVAVGIIVALKQAGLGTSGQLIALAVPTFFATLYVTRLLPGDLVRIIILSIVRTAYNVKPVNPQHVPREGGVLLLPNHVSYVDAVILGSACDRKVRFVMWDVLYKLWWMNWGLRALGVVPISATRAKDAIRSVANALKEGEIVCLFPEGQITRHGMINELRKGFELMARQADAKVVPVYLDGLYGSIFSYEGGIVFKKWPKALRYPVSVHFGQPMSAKEATTAAVRAQHLDLAAQAWTSRKVMTGLAKGTGDALKQQAAANALRLCEIEWARPGDTLLCLAPVGGIIHEILSAYTGLKHEVSLVTRDETVQSCADASVIAVGGVQDLEKVAAVPAWDRAGRFVMIWDDAAAEVPDAPRVYRGLLDHQSGLLIAVSIPNPPMPKGEEDGQPGSRPGALGRLLPGVEACLPLDDRLARLQLELSDEGFVVRRRPKEAAPPETDEAA